MILIAHRGNVNGPQPKFENRPDYVDRALKMGYDVEIDLWVVGKDILLGHDEGEHPVSPLWLSNRESKLWVHCKNVAAMELMAKMRIVNMRYMNYFWHDKDDYTMTRGGFVWAYPGKPPVGNNTIMVMPEQKWSFEVVHGYLEGAAGVCSDYVGRLK